MSLEKIYIIYRKVKSWMGSILFYLFRVFPIRGNRICVTTFEGKGGFNCNPKYIVEEMHRRNHEYEFIWLVNDENKVFPSYIRKEKNNLLKRAYYLTTSKIWIDNYRKSLETRKRKGQYYINTWHGNLGFKAIGLWRGEGFSKIAYMVSKHDSNMIDYMISSSDWTTEAFVKGMVYNGRFLKLGQAREDVLINNREKTKKKIKDKFGVSESCYIVMYAPTYREKKHTTNRDVVAGETSFDKKKILELLGGKFGGNWILFQRLHPQLATKISKMKDADGEKIIDVSQYDDMYELLAASDVVVTDFSSIAFEAGSIKIPVFLYMDDMNEYVNSRGGMNFLISPDKTISTNRDITPHINVNPPFLVATDNEELEERIKEFDKDSYCKRIDEMCIGLGLVNDGKASKRVADLVESLLLK